MIDNNSKWVIALGNEMKLFGIEELYAFSSEEGDDEESFVAPFSGGELMTIDPELRRVWAEIHELIHERSAEGYYTIDEEGEGCPLVFDERELEWKCE